MRRIIYVITCLMSLSLHSEAQTHGNALRGLVKIQILIEDLNNSSLECGLTEALIRNAVLYPISAASIVVTEFAPVALYVNANSLFPGSEQICVTNIYMRAETMQNVILDYSGRTVFSNVELWSDGMILFTDRAYHARHVAETVEDLAKKFVTDWNLDNKPAAGRR
jgi:hypothetical protein